MRILHFPSNSGNHPGGLAAAERSLGFDSDLVTLVDHAFGYSAGSSLGLQDAPRLAKLKKRLLEARKLYKQYDVIHFNGGQTAIPGSLPAVFDLAWLRRQGKKVFVTLQGSDARPHQNLLKRRIQSERIRQIAKWSHGMWCLNPDLLDYVPGASFLPYANLDVSKTKVASIPEKHANFNRRPLRIVHAPSRRHLKGTEAVIQAVEYARSYREIDLDLVENTNHAQAMERYRRADVAIDQLLIGWYGGFAVECMAMGIPVICKIDEHHKKLAAMNGAYALVNQLPFIAADKSNLGEILRSLDTESLARSASQCRKFVVDFHDPNQIAHTTTDLYLST